MQINQSRDIHIDDCANINVAQLEEIYSNIVLFDTLKNTFDSVNEAMNHVGSANIHQCGWINDRILGNRDTQNINYDSYRTTLNNLVCTRDRRCDPSL